MSSFIDVVGIFLSLSVVQDDVNIALRDWRADVGPSLERRYYPLKDSVVGRDDYRKTLLLLLGRGRQLW